jgi:phosphoribosylformylglycinamidine synthase
MEEPGVVSMSKNRVKVCVLRVGGTNCDAETQRSLVELGADAEVVHMNQIVEKKKLEEYDALVIPGGFSYGDYVRAGVIWAKEILGKIGPNLKTFLEEEKPVLGICNGFQVLVETGLLPGIEGISPFPTATLATNFSAKYECRWIHLIHENRGRCIFTQDLTQDQVLYMPVAHGEGCFALPKENEKKLLDKLIENDQIVLRYCNRNGSPAEGRYPENPNGSIYDIAGICDPTGIVFGLMPHPERAFYGWQLPNWTSLKELPVHADGKQIFKSMLDYFKNR